MYSFLPHVLFYTYCKIAAKPVDTIEFEIFAQDWGTDTVDS